VCTCRPLGNHPHGSSTYSTAVLCPQHYYPFVYVLPTGHLFNLIDRRSRMFTMDGECQERALLPQVPYAFAVCAACRLLMAVVTPQ
jgi:hypothetical protein